MVRYQISDIRYDETSDQISDIRYGETALFLIHQIDQWSGKVGAGGENATLEDFEIFNVRNTVNIIAYSVMSAGKTSSQNLADAMAK